MVDFKDYYKILNITKSATDKEIKDAFRKLAKQYHPDSEGGSEDKFKDINEAYEVLKDSKKKHKYDMMLKYQNSFDAPNSFSEKQSQASQAYKQSKMYSDFQSFSEYMNYQDIKRKQDQRAKQANSSSTNKKKESSFSDFFEMLFGRQQEREAEAKSTAKPSTTQAQNGEDFEMDLELSLEDAYEGCLRKIEISSAKATTRRLEVTIPPGVREGVKIKVSGEGKPGTNGGKNGDLYLRVRLKEHPYLWLEGDDVHSELKLLPHEAILGADKEIATLSGFVELTIPPKTQNSKILRLRSKGLRSSKDSSQNGDHYVHVVLNIPKEPSSEELELYKKIAAINKPNK